MWRHVVYCTQYLRGNECRALASICVGRRVWRHNTALYSFFEILEIIFAFMQSHVYIPYNVISGSLYFFMFQSYRDLAIITFQFAYRNMFSRLITFNHYNRRSNQPWHNDRMFSQTVYVMKKLIISIWIHRI